MVGFHPGKTFGIEFTFTNNWSPHLDFIILENKRDRFRKNGL